FDGEMRSPSELVRRINEINSDIENNYYDTEDDINGELEAAGFDYSWMDRIDGVILRNVDDSMDAFGGKISTHYAVFHPEQIKSVNNRGTWDPNDSRILFQPAQHFKDL